MQTFVSANLLTISLRDLMESPMGWGHVQGALVAAQVRSRIEAYPALIVRLLLNGGERVDVSFASELVKLAQSYRGWRGLCLAGPASQDMRDNWEGSAFKLGYPLFGWDAAMMNWYLLGPEPSVGLKEMLHYVLRVPVVRTVEAATALNLKVPNASNKLRQLWLSGYILRREQSAENGGGVEHEYFCIR